MLIFYRPFTDPYLNIAAEEYFIKQSAEDICMIWLNERSVIIGKHQNAFAEINYPYVHTNHIPVIRRISGGGAVYHDMGNVNFTFIKKTVKSNQVDFSQFTSVLVAFMQSLGIEINVNKRNSLFIGSQKFSGNAEHIFHDRVLHHGTLLFNTDLEVLQKSLIPEKEYQGKAMKSVRSEVCNLAPLLSKTIDIHEFIRILIVWLRDYYAESKSYELTEYDLKTISELSETKYKTWEWNFGYSPAYHFQTEIPMISGLLPITVNVENGKFVQINSLSENRNPDLAVLLNNMAGILHKEEEIDKFVEENKQLLELVGANTVLFTSAFFQ